MLNIINTDPDSRYLVSCLGDGRKLAADSKRRKRWTDSFSRHAKTYMKPSKIRAAFRLTLTVPDLVFCLLTVQSMEFVQ